MLLCGKMKRFCFLSIVLACLLAPGRQAGAQESGGRVTFCSYNLKNYLKMERFVGGKRAEGIDKPQGEIEAAVRFVSMIDPDVLGVVEIGSREDLEDLRSRLKLKGLDYAHVEHVHGGDAVRALGLLSRLPIVAREPQQDLKYQIGEQVFPMLRGILDVTLQVREGFQLRCLGVHLKSKREVADGDQSLMRRNEAHLLRRHVVKILEGNPETHLLVFGDFNENSNEAPLVELRGVSGTPVALSDLKLEDTRGQTWTHYWEYADVYSRFDYFFVNRSLMRKVDRKASYVFDQPDFLKASDHRPIVVSFDPGKK